MGRTVPCEDSCCQEMKKRIRHGMEFRRIRLNRIELIIRPVNTMMHREIFTIMKTKLTITNRITTNYFIQEL